MVIVGKLTYRGRTVELRREEGEHSFWIENAKHTEYENRSADVIKALNGRPLGFWQEASKALIDREEGPEFTQTITLRTPSTTDKTPPKKGGGLRGSGLIDIFTKKQGEQENKEKP